eukprot:XP_001706553.1 Hypothetical protein GL50803_37518 [Giardia lamblia ATCC 50803]
MYCIAQRGQALRGIVCGYSHEYKLIPLFGLGKKPLRHDCE